MLIANETDDLLDARSWRHNCNAGVDAVIGMALPRSQRDFQIAGCTEDQIVYHAKTVNKYTYAGRSTRVKI